MTIYIKARKLEWFMKDEIRPGLTGGYLLNRMVVLLAIRGVFCNALRSTLAIL